MAQLKIQSQALSRRSHLMKVCAIPRAEHVAYRKCDSLVLKKNPWKTKLSLEFGVQNPWKRSCRNRTIVVWEFGFGSRTAM